MTGHVFVIQGDIRRFACDAYLFATDRDLRKGGRWMQSAPMAASRLDPSLREAFKREERFTLPLMDRDGIENEPTTILTAVPYEGMKSPDEIVERLEEFFRVSSEVARLRGVTQTMSKREKPLLAVPLFGSGGGGGGAFAGGLLRTIDEQSRIAAKRYDVDVAVVLSNPRAYALAQMTRRGTRESWAELEPRTHTKAKELGEIARRARLVPFMGAGVSVSAGAPDWSGLLRGLARSAGIDSALIDQLMRRHDSLDQAAFVREALMPRGEPRNDAFTSAIIQAVDKRRYGLAPPLLAALEAEQAITLNYDKLFEWAALDVQRPRRVIPGINDGSERWLLKLHGTIDDPGSIVLTRDDYLGFNSDRAALSSLVKATLMTRHLLFVGFGMRDPHFHEIVHDVRRALPKRAQPFGTVLTLNNDEVTRMLWAKDLDFVTLGSPRELEIFLDAMLAYGATSEAYLLAQGFESVLDDDDRELRDALIAMKRTLPLGAKNSSAWPAVERALRDLGYGTNEPRQSWGMLPEGLE